MTGDRDIEVLAERIRQLEREASQNTRTLRGYDGHAGIVGAINKIQEEYNQIKKLQLGIYAAVLLDVIMHAIDIMP